MVFPQCHLHGRHVVYSLPQGCPFKSADVEASLRAIRDASFFDPQGIRDAGDALAAAEVYRICNDCVGRLSGHSRIRILREREGLIA